MNQNGTVTRPGGASLLRAQPAAPLETAAALSKNARRCMANAIAGRLSVLLAKLHPYRSTLGLMVVCAVTLACQSREQPAAARPDRTSSSVAVAPSAAPAVSALPVASGAPAEMGQQAPTNVPRCSAGKQLVPGGRLWIGSDPKEHFAEDESPRFQTELAPYCLDATEVTVERYRACVEQGRCSKPIDKQFHCNYRYADRGTHPINCVNWRQANQFCEAQGERLPSEAEWEAAARGGDRYFEYSWGNESPDGRNCWKQPHSCPVKSYPAGAFGLFDMTGNVWEWVDDYYGPYPWPPQDGTARVYRGGSWSRRFEKWLHTRLRNREHEGFSGSHLGFRCAMTPSGVSCPSGKAENGRCLPNVLTRECEAPRAWNGARCAKADEPRCRPGRVEVPGHGCVLEAEAAPASLDLDAEKAGVTAVRTPELDPDCRQNFRDRPQAFRYSGGTHRGRNLVSRSAGCKNRDVGVGFNSTCCP
jgi:formylglycine-generating enzyme required for sulfatase activity